jgi:hypothetical protein
MGGAKSHTKDGTVRTAWAQGASGADALAREEVVAAALAGIRRITSVMSINSINSISSISSINGISSINCMRE